VILIKGFGQKGAQTQTKRRGGGEEVKKRDFFRHILFCDFDQVIWPKRMGKIIENEEKKI
jgi:hypothetical protein